MSLPNVQNEGWQDSLLQPGVVLAEFGAVWCPPCRVLLPQLEELQTELGEAVKILKVDVEDAPAPAAAYGIMSMPTVIIFKDGEPVEKLVGLRPMNVYRSVLERYMPAQAQ